MLYFSFNIVSFSCFVLKIVLFQPPKKSPLATALPKAFRMYLVVSISVVHRISNTQKPLGVFHILNGSFHHSTRLKILIFSTLYDLKHSKILRAGLPCSKISLFYFSKTHRINILLCVLFNRIKPQYASRLSQFSVFCHFHAVLMLSSNEVSGSQPNSFAALVLSA